VGGGARPVLLQSRRRQQLARLGQRVVLREGVRLHVGAQGCRHLGHLAHQHATGSPLPARVVRLAAALLPPRCLGQLLLLAPLLDGEGRRIWLALVRRGQRVLVARAGCAVQVPGAW
jgi:hypothetical protein